MDFLIIGAWLAIAYLVLGALSTVYFVGRPREPMGSGTAVMTLILATILIAILYGLIQRAG